MTFTEQVEEALRAVAFHSRSRYSWFGKLSPRLHASVRRDFLPRIERNHLLWSLQSELYTNFYCRGFPTPDKSEAVRPQDVGATPFVQKLSTANSGSGCCEDGWTVHAITDCDAVVRREGLELTVSHEDCLLPPPHQQLASGMRLGLRFPKELLSISPGFYTALSNKDLPANDSQRLVRFYWNLTAEGAVSFMRKATLILNRDEVPFRIKAVNDPLRFARCDAVVLYVRKGDYACVSEVMEAIYPEVVTHLKNREPAFTKRLAAGVGFAEDPGQGASFGSDRCRILAEGMIRAHERHRKAIQGRLEVVKECFEESGINWSMPFLASGGDDRYDFRPRSPQGASGRSNCVPPDSDEEAFLRTTAEIGERVVQDAVWYEGRCNWMGNVTNEAKADTAAPLMKYSALGPELYSGTSGISLFLAELYSATGDAGVRRTALGAIRQALSRVDAVQPAAYLGLHSGWMGIAFAAACVGRSLNEDEVLEHATLVLRRAASVDVAKCEFDFVSGKAGAVTALVRLVDLLDDSLLLTFARRLGDDLLQSAEKDECGYSWKSSDSSDDRNLTGFAHGTAGVGHALLELFEATGDSRYRHGADQAFSYERHWFDEHVGNWPDFRGEPGGGKRVKLPLRYGTTWCHGAPGIALSRVRAYEIVREATYKAEALAALQATRQITRTWLHSEMEDYCLCHGLSGNADILLYGWQVLGEECPDGYALAHEAASAAIASGSDRGHWGLGRTGSGETPGLMLGLAGLGYLCLRLHDQATRSPLSLGKSQRGLQSKGPDSQGPAVVPHGRQATVRGHGDLVSS